MGFLSMLSSGGQLCRIILKGFLCSKMFATRHIHPSSFISLFFFFFFCSRVSARIWGFSNRGGPSKRPPKNFFSPQKRSSRASRAPLCRPQSGEAKGAPGLIAAMSSFTSCVSGRGGLFGGRGWKLNKVKGPVRVESDGVCFFYCMVLQSLQCCSGNM